MINKKLRRSFLLRESWEGSEFLESSGKKSEKDGCSEAWGNKNKEWDSNYNAQCSSSAEKMLDNTVVCKYYQKLLELEKNVSTTQ